MLSILKSLLAPRESGNDQASTLATNIAEAQITPQSMPQTKPVRHIPMMRMEVRSACQYDCEMCAHGAQRKLLKDYELSLEQLERFLTATRESGYIIDNMRIHGPGEPLLWHSFNEGVRMLKASGVVSTVFVASNALLMRKIEEKTWDCIDELRVSLYADFNRQTDLEEAQKKYGGKIAISPMDNFVILPKSVEEAKPIPCRCMCDGPMLLGDRIYLYCGPPVFGAGELLSRDVQADPDLSVPVGLNYMERYDQAKLGNMDYCTVCWANEYFFSRTVPQKTTGGNWK